MAVLARVLRSARLRPVMAGSTFLTHVHRFVSEPAGWMQDGKERRVTGNAALLDECDMRRMTKHYGAGRCLGPAVRRVWWQP